MAAENRKLKVFICHSKADKAKVRKLCHRLINDGFDVWLDEEKLTPGQDWDLEIRRSIRDTDIVLACLSNNSVTKTGYVQKEIRFALDVASKQPEGKTFIIPVRFEDCSLPESLRHLQWANLFERNGYKKLNQSLHRQMDYLNIRFDSNEVLPKSAEDRILIPILGPIATGIPLPEFILNTIINLSKKADTIEIAREILPLKERNGDLFALEAIGDGLVDAMINDGDIVILKPTVVAGNGEMVAIWLPRGNETTLKYFFKEKDRYRLQPANPSMKPIYVKLTEPLEIKGKVVMIIHKMDGGLEHKR